MLREFKYLNPKTLSEALKLLEKHKDDEYKIVCGGQSILIMMRQGLVVPDYVIDIKGITELSYIKGDAKKGLKIGALTTHRAIEKSAVIEKNYPVLSQMEERVASIQTRNWGTLGGNIAHGDPAGDPAPVLIALNATVTIASEGKERTVPVEKFFRDYFDTDLKHGEMLTEFQIPPVPAGTGTAYTKFNLIDTDMATTGAAVSLTVSADGNCKDARIALGAAAPTPMRARKAEASLVGKKVTEALLKDAGEMAAKEAEPISDIHASSDYRRELVRVLVRRMGKEALARAKA
jgi:aerobic carbon-monoxide dehydrogenase medium subunit